MGLRRLVGLAGAASLLASAVALAPGVAAAPACAASGSRAALVVEHGNGSVRTRCVAFSGSSITGEALLNASGISWSGQSFTGLGMAVCAVDGEPAQYSDCLGDGFSWTLFVSRGGGAWRLSASGVSNIVLSSGDALGLRYGPSGGTAPPVSPAGVCPTATPPPTPAPVRTALPIVTTRLATPSVAADGLPSGSPSASLTAAGSSATAAGEQPAPSGESTTAASLAPSSSGGPGGSGGSDGPGSGLVAGVLAIGSLGGIAVLRLFAARRPVR